jgi:broad specificity phosphatase PhoE
MEIYLLRHAVSTSNEKKLVCGASDFPLSENGYKQASCICTFLNEIKFTRIYSSPLKRALQTIEKLKSNIKIKIDPELIELDTGKYSHLSVDELFKLDQRYRYQGLNPKLRYPGGECLEDMIIRLRSWYQMRLPDWEKDDVILVSGHEGTVCGLLHHLLQLNLSHYPTFIIGNCDYVKITINEDDQIRYRFFSLENLK